MFLRPGTSTAVRKDSVRHCKTIAFALTLVCVVSVCVFRIACSIPSYASTSSTPSASADAHHTENQAVRSQPDHPRTRKTRIQRSASRYRSSGTNDTCIPLSSLFLRPDALKKGLARYIRRGTSFINPRSHRRFFDEYILVVMFNVNFDDKM